MKKFLIKTLVFLAPALVFVVLCEMGLRTRESDYKYKSQWLTENASTVEILVLGSSHAYSGINPAAFSRKAFNGAHMSQDLNYDAFIFRKFAPRMDSLKYLILPISYFTPYWRLEETPDKGRVKNYMLHYGCPDHPHDLRYRVMIYDGLRPKMALGSLLGMESPRFFSDLGFLTDYTFQKRKENWRETGRAAAERHTDGSLDEDRFNANLGHARSIASLCEKKGVVLILLTTPTYKTYREHMLPEQHEKMLEFCRLVASGYPNVVYLDLEEDGRFQEDDYYDADHLNERGAEKLTSILDRFILDLT